MAKRIVKPFRILNDVDLVDGLTTDATDIPYVDGGAYQAVWSSNTSGTGTLVVEGSNWDHAVGTTQEWSLLDMDPIPVEGTSGSVIINLSGLQFDAVRLRYIEDVESVGGKITVFVSTKAVGV